MLVVGWHFYHKESTSSSLLPHTPAFCSSFPIFSPKLARFPHLLYIKCLPVECTIPPFTWTCIHTLNVCPIQPLFSLHLSLSTSLLSLSFFCLFLSVYPSLSVSLSLSPTDSSDSDLELSTVRHQPEGLDQLQAQTKFTRKELQSLYRGFKNVRLAAEMVLITLPQLPCFI